MATAVPPTAKKCLVPDTLLETLMKVQISDKVDESRLVIQAKFWNPQTKAAMYVFRGTPRGDDVLLQGFMYVPKRRINFPARVDILASKLARGDWAGVCECELDPKFQAQFWKHLKRDLKSTFQ